MENSNVIIDGKLYNLNTMNQDELKNFIKLNEEKENELFKQFNDILAEDQEEVLDILEYINNDLANIINNMQEVI